MSISPPPGTRVLLIFSTASTQHGYPWRVEPVDTSTPVQGLPARFETQHGAEWFITNYRLRKCARPSPTPPHLKAGTPVYLEATSAADPGLPWALVPLLEKDGPPLKFVSEKHARHYAQKRRLQLVDFDLLPRGTRVVVTCENDDRRGRKWRIKAADGADVPGLPRAFPTPEEAGEFIRTKGLLPWVDFDPNAPRTDYRWTLPGKTLAQIAKQHLNIQTLEPRNSDRLDFHELGVWGIRAALEAAYKAGQESRR